MNRAERRRLEKQGQQPKKEAVINIKSSDIQEMKKAATNEAADLAFILMLGLPILVLHDKYGFGKVRCERFIDQVLYQYQLFEEGRMTLDDVKAILKEESGITFERTVTK